MVDNRKSNEKNPGDKYNPGNQAGKTAGVTKKVESEKEDGVRGEEDSDAQKRS